MIDNIFLPERLRLYTVMMLAAIICFQVASFATNDRGRTAFGANLGGDFPAFYVVGSIYNEQGAAGLYDAEQHSLAYHKLFPNAPAVEQLPFLYPPLFALIFSPLARLPYPLALAVWLCATLLFCLAGLRLAGASRDAMIATFACAPFVEVWAGGQLSGLAFLGVSVALNCRSYWWQGVGLALCSYKPTLLLLVVPLLLLQRRWRLLAVFAAGVCLLLCLSVAVAGSDGLPAYARQLINYGQAAQSGVIELRLWKYVDLSSAVQLLIGRYRVVRWLMLACAVVVVVKLSRLKESLAPAFAATLVLNVYVPIYDVILLVPCALMYRDCWSDVWFKRLLLALFVGAWITQPLARVSGVQILTPLLACFAFYLTRASLSASRPAS